MKKTTKIVAFMVTVIICFATLLSSCHANTVKQTHTTFDYFDTVSTLTVYTDKKSFEKYKEIFESVAQKYHELFDIYNEHDGVFGLYELNRTIGEHEISSELMDFLKEARRMHDLTGGHTNIAMGNVTSIWHETRERANASPNDASLPHMSALESASEHTDISALKLNTVKMTVERLDTEMSLDAGALGKGYTADRIAEALTDAGCESFLINLGGNVSSHGKKPNGDPWLATVEDPTIYIDSELEEISLPTAINVSDMSLVTSGSYHRYFELDGKRYHHIIDPDTLMPSEYLLSVSVLTRSSLQADALSTALFSMSIDEGISLLKSLEDVYVIWIDNDGNVTFSDGFDTHIYK